MTKQYHIVHLFHASWFIYFSWIFFSFPHKRLILLLKNISSLLTSIKTLASGAEVNNLSAGTPWQPRMTQQRERKKWVLARVCLGLLLWMPVVKISFPKEMIRRQFWSNIQFYLDKERSWKIRLTQIYAETPCLLGPHSRTSWNEISWW